MSSAPKTIITETEKSSAGGSGLARANPVALEVPVSVTGARAGGAGARELFTEEAQTVLVFRDGAVIRLTGAVSEGQLLFVTNKKSKEEVVCQVVHTREAGPTSAYVELLFSEEKADFWGASFETTGSPVTDFQRQDQVEAEKTTMAEPGATVEPHKPVDVDHLKKEVEALRKKLFDSAKGNAAAGKTAGTSSDTPLMPGAAESHEPARAMVGMSLPMAKHEGERDPAEELLPKPELDFSHAPSGESGQNVVRKPLRPPRVVSFKKVLVPAFCVLVLGLAAVAWTAKPWNYFGAVKALVLKPVAAKPGKAFVPAASRPAVVASPAGNAGKAVVKSDAAQSPMAAMPEKNAIVTAPASKENVATTKSREVSAGVAAMDPANGAEKPAKRMVPVGRKSGSPSATAEKKAAELAVNDAPVLPAKLLKVANPVYPPEAMRSFITGDVRAEAVVEADGHVGEVKILSGPKLLREAATDALKQYQYAPATQGGKGVASKVMVTVKFWFNP